MPTAADPMFSIEHGTEVVEGGRASPKRALTPQRGGFLRGKGGGCSPSQRRGRQRRACARARARCTTHVRPSEPLGRLCRPAGRPSPPPVPRPLAHCSAPQCPRPGSRCSWPCRLRLCVSPRLPGKGQSPQLAHPRALPDCPVGSGRSQAAWLQITAFL